MKKSFILVLTLILPGCPLALFAQSGPPFQGEVDVDMTAAGAKMNGMVYIFKGTKKKAVSVGADGSIVSFTLVDKAKKVVNVVSATDKTYQSFPFVGPPKVSGAALKEVAVTKTGNTKSIAGKDCDEYQVTSEGTSEKIWATRANPNIRWTSEARLGNAAAEKLQKMGLLIMEMDVSPMAYVVTKVTERPVKDSEFDIPADYSEKK